MIVAAEQIEDSLGPQRSPLVLDVRVVTGTGGGPEKTLLNTPRSLERLGYRGLCAFLHPPGDVGFETIRQRAAECRAEIVSVSDRGPWDLRVVRRLVQLCRRERVAIWHGHDYKSNALGLLVRRFWPMKLVTTVHGWVKQTWRTPLYYWVDRRCLRYYERVICVSPDLVAHCRACGVSDARCLHIENGIDTDQFSRHRTTQEAKRALGFPVARTLIGSIGRLSAEKAFEVLIRAVNLLIRSGQDVGLVILGDGDQTRSLQALIRSLDLHDRVQLLGHRSNITDYLEAMDIFALASRREGLPNALLEAMALEVPAVVTAVGGVPQLVTNDVNGLLVDVEAIEPLAAAIHRLADHAALRCQLGLAGRRTVCGEYSFARRMRRMAAVYDELLLSSRQPAAEHAGRSILIGQEIPVVVAEKPRAESGSCPVNGSAAPLSVHIHWGQDAICESRLERLQRTKGHGAASRSGDLRWLNCLHEGLGHTPYLIEALRDGRVVGWLPLAYLQSLAFGRFLVSLPYVNSAGVVVEEKQVAATLIGSAVRLANQLGVRYLELRHEAAVSHPALTQQMTAKVHMRLGLPRSAKELWASFDPKVRNQVRKAEKLPFTIAWGGEELLREFDAVFSRNMRDLGTPAYGVRFFRSVLKTFSNCSEICCVRLHEQPVAVALVLHGEGVTEVPSASSLREYRPTNANMLMYWKLLERAVQRGQQVFDFGRSSRGSNTFRFKEQWGAEPHPAVWQYYLRKGQIDDLRPENEKFRLATRVWQRLPLFLTRYLGPRLVRGIP